MPVRANAACTSSAALALGLLLAVSACGGDDRPSPRLQPEMVESLAGAEAYDSGSNVAISCDALGFRDESRTWLVECVQEKKTSWVVDDQTKEVRPADAGNGGTAPGRGLLLTANRDRLALCVESAGAPLAAQASGQSAVEDVLADVSAAVSATHPELADPPPVVDQDCPGERPSPTSSWARSYFELPGRRVENASYYRVHVYIVSPEELSRMAGDPPFQLATEEFVCSDDDCRDVTMALYLSADQVGDAQFLRDNLEKALGLKAPF